MPHTQHTAPLPDLESLPPQTRQRLRVPIGSALDDDHLSIPVEILVGSAPHPRVSLVAGIHGDEMEGIFALQDLVQLLEPASLAGTVVLIPVANVASVQVGRRLVPIDGADLNRSFPGDPAGGFSERLCAALLSIIDGSDFLYSLHGWGSYGEVVRYLEFPIGNDPAAKRSRAVAVRLGFNILRESNWHPGLMGATALRMGIPSLEGEVGGLGLGTTAGSEFYRLSVLNLLRCLRILSDPIPPAVHPAMVSHFDVRAPASGFLRASVGLMDEVSPGHEIGRIVDVFGDLIAPILSPKTGFIASRRGIASVRVGDRLFTIFSARDAAPSVGVE